VRERFRFLCFILILLVMLLMSSASPTAQQGLPDWSNTVQVAAFFLEQGDVLVRSGSGSIIESSGLTLTTSAVIRRFGSMRPGGCGEASGSIANLIIILIAENEGARPMPQYVASYAADDQTVDLAVIQIEKLFIADGINDYNDLVEAISDKGSRAFSTQDLTDELPSVTLGDSDSIEPGQEVEVFGYPNLIKILGGGTIPSCWDHQEGTIKHAYREAQLFSVELKAETSFTSGSVVVDKEMQQVIGVLCGQEKEGVRLARPINLIRWMLDMLAEYKEEDEFSDKVGESLCSQ